MGQYYYVVNLDKKEFLYPHKLGDGLKLWEICAGGGTSMALVALLADGNGRGGGDFNAHPLVGSWCGDRIVVAGDYADNGRFLKKRKFTKKESERLDFEIGESHGHGFTTDLTLHEFAGLFYKDISLEMRELLISEGLKLGERWDTR